MDSLSQLVLGSAVGIAVMGRRTPVWKAALVGGICGTLPDLDALVDRGDPIRNMTLHRAETHALVYLTLAAPPIAWLVSRIAREAQHFRRWWLAVWLALATHPLLDAMTVYGTQLGLPFTDYPFGVGSMFIIDPLYTLPLVVGVIAALLSRARAGFALNAAGLALSTGYLAWSVAAQQHVERIALAALRDAGIAADRVLVTPAPFNTVLWRVVAMTPEAYYEGFHSLLDDGADIRFDRFERNRELYEALAGDWHVERIAWFSHGFFAMGERDGLVTIADLRMGQEPAYVFTFVVARRASPELVPVRPRAVVIDRNVEQNLHWLWRRLKGDRLEPPRAALTHRRARQA